MCVRRAGHPVSGRKLHILFPRSAATAMAKRKAAQVPERPTKAAKSASVEVVQNMLASGTDSGVNANYNSMISSAITTVMSHPIFETLACAPALGIDEGGFKEAYNDSARKRAMKNDNKYEASCNFLMCSMFWSVDKNVPRSLGRVRRFGASLFPDGRAPGLSTVLVVVLDSKDKDPMLSYGANKLISPLEVPHALWLRAEEQIESGASEETLRSYVTCFRSVSLRFDVFTCYTKTIFEAVFLRDQFVKTDTELERTVCQRIHEVLVVKAELEKAANKKLSIKGVQEQYEKNVNLRLGVQVVTDSFIEQAITVYNKLLSVPACSEIISKFEDAHGTHHSLNNITTLSGLVYRVGRGCADQSRGAERLHHVLAQLQDEVSHGVRPATQMSKEWLLGKAKDGKGHVDVCLRKLDMSNALLGRFREMGISNNAMEKMQRLMECHAKYREMCGSEFRRVDQSWMGALSTADQHAVVLMIKVKYSNDQDSTLLATLGSQSASEFLDDGPFVDDIKEIQSLLTDANDKRPELPPTEPEEGKIISAEPMTKDNVWEHLVPNEETKVESAEESDPQNRTLIDELAEYRRYAVNVTARYVSTVTEPASATAFADYLRASPTGTLRGNTDGKGFIVVNYDSKQTGETKTNPSIRVPGVMENGHLQKLVGGVLLSRVAKGDVPTDLDEGDAFLLWDGGKHGNEAALLAGFKRADNNKKMDISKLCLYIQFSESSFVARRERVRAGPAQWNCMEFTYLVTKCIPQFNGDARLHYDGTNRGNCIGPVHLPPHSELACVTVKEKKDVGQSSL